MPECSDDTLNTSSEGGKRHESQQNLLETMWKFSQIEKEYNNERFSLIMLHHICNYD